MKRTVTIPVLALAAVGVLSLGAPALAADSPGGQDYTGATAAPSPSVLPTTVTRTTAPAVAATVAVSSPAAVQPAAPVAATSTGALPFTGTDAVLGGAALGAVLIAAGTGLRVVGRRRQA